MSKDKKRLDIYRALMAAMMGGGETDGMTVDSGQVWAAARELTYVEQQLFETPYPPLGSEKIAPRFFGAGAWAVETSFKTIDGGSEWSAVQGSAQDYPEVALGADETTNPVREYGASYSYTRKDLIRAARLGVPLDATKARVVQQGYEELVDKMALLGDPTRKVKGIKSYFGDGTSGTIKAKTASTRLTSMTDDEILSFLLSPFREAAQDCAQAVRPDTLVLPPLTVDYLAERRLGTANGNMTILDFVTTKSRHVRRVIDWRRLQNNGDAYKDDSAAMNIMLALKVDPTVLRHQIPEPFMPLEPERLSGDVRVKCVASVGAVEMIQPLAVRAVQFRSDGTSG